MSNKHKILIIDECHSSLMAELEGFQCNYQPNIGLAELEEIIGEYEVLVLRSKLFLDKQWIDRANKLRLIGRLGSGMDNIDLDHAASKGIECVNAPEGNRVAVAEHCMAMMLSLLANIPQSSLELKQGIWNRKEHIGTELSSKTVGIIGYGNVGKALADRLQAFGCRILAYDLYKKGFATASVEEVSLIQLKEEADIVSIHVPLNEHSRQMINSKFIAEMKKNFYLLNLSRGQVVESAALRQGLKDSKLLALGLDVFENETPNAMNEEERELFDYLTHHPKVIFTPHIAGLSTESYQKLSLVLAQKIKAFFS